jgi:adenylylsulfate kinase-like enzyme
MKTVITLFGLPGSGKTTLGDMIHKLIGGARINADVVRSSISTDLKFTDDDRAIQAWRMGRLAAIALAEPPTVVSGENMWNLNKTVIVDFVNPTERTRRTYDWAIRTELPFQFNHVKIWMNTITPEQSRFPDTAKLFEEPSRDGYTFNLRGYSTLEALENYAKTVVQHINMN